MPILKKKNRRKKRGEHEGISHSAVAPVFSALIFPKLQGFFFSVVVVVFDMKYQSFMRSSKASNAARSDIWRREKKKSLRGWSDCSQNQVEMENSFRRKAPD